MDKLASTKWKIKQERGIVNMRGERKNLRKISFRQRKWRLYEAIRKREMR
jgi:hypothetical protein